MNVALIDTGVHAAHPDLQGPSGSRVVHCEDLTHEDGTAAECADTFGHGTFMAGLIAGNGDSSNGRYMGAAPGAGIVSIKVAGFDGATDMSTLLAGRGAARSHGGTGLGLAIVRELAQAQGGKAWYEQGRMGGATFCIRLPAAAADAGEPSHEHSLSRTAG